MNDYISLSALNDFIFCPYSIYLHNVYMEMDEDIYKASPQIKGSLAHVTIDNKTASSNKTDLMSLSVYSDTLKIFGKIDMFKTVKHQLIERKNNLKSIYRGQLYQLWGQYFCLVEMGYDVRELFFYEMSTNKMLPINLPGEEERCELEQIIKGFRNYISNLSVISVDPHKCRHCVYCNLCDKTDVDNVYI